MVTQSELERERYEARLKYRRDESARLHDAEMKGEERGEKRGEERGEERGILMVRVQQCERLLKQDPMPRAALRSLSLQQLGELADRLEKQAAERS